MTDLVLSRRQLRQHYADKFHKRGLEFSLKFTFDGNLMGDLGEALAVDLFGIELVTGRNSEGFDGYAPRSPLTVQIKATGTGRGPAFRVTETRADHLLFFDLNLENLTGDIVYNGPEHYAMSFLPQVFSGQRSLTPNQIRRADLLVQNDERLQRMFT